MPRLDIERQKKLEPKRISVAKKELAKLNIAIDAETSTTIKFTYKGATITYYPYSGWHTGKTIQDGRGLERLIKQLKS